MNDPSVHSDQFKHPRTLCVDRCSQGGRQRRMPCTVFMPAHACGGTHARTLARGQTRRSNGVGQWLSGHPRPEHGTHTYAVALHRFHGGELARCYTHARRPAPISYESSGMEGTGAFVPLLRGPAGMGRSVSGHGKFDDALMRLQYIMRRCACSALRGRRMHGLLRSGPGSEETTRSWAASWW
jgi:hypothetical protein